MSNLNRFNFSPDTTITPDQADEYANAAMPYYSRFLPYHNWNHAVETIRGVEVITKKLEEKGIASATGALAVAAAWHDAGYQDNHITKGFDTKEAYSAALLEAFLEGKPVGELEKRLMLSAIKETWGGHKGLRMPVQLILHRADVANIGGPTEAFLDNFSKLWAEANFTSSDGRASWETFVQRSDHFIRFTAAEHDFENLGHYIDADDTTLDVNEMPFSEAAALNLAALSTLEPESR